MGFKNIVIYFLVGGTVTALIVALEESNFRILSGIAALFPVFTVIPYLFLGDSLSGKAVGDHATMILVGSIISWLPHMLTLIFLAPQIGNHKAIGVALIVFFVFAISFLLVVQKFNLFQ